MSKTLIKICGLTNPQIAAETAKAGADFIGLIFHPLSIRYIDLETAKQIAAATKDQGAQPVAVFVNQTAAEITDICEQTDIQIIQLHGDIARQQHPFLDEKYRRIIVKMLDNNAQEPSPIALDNYSSTRDFLLFDNLQAGKGQTFDWQQFHYQGIFPWFLAGGLTVDNVGTAIKLLHPTCVDVSSGVERQPGVKDINLIKRFIQVVKSQQGVN